MNSHDGSWCHKVLTTLALHDVICPLSLQSPASQTLLGDFQLFKGCLWVMQSIFSATLDSSSHSASFHSYVFTLKFPCTPDPHWHALHLPSQPQPNSICWYVHDRLHHQTSELVSHCFLRRLLFSDQHLSTLCRLPSPVLSFLFFVLLNYFFFTFLFILSVHTPFLQKDKNKKPEGVIFIFHFINQILTI